jgi:hypothetical protein
VARLSSEITANLNVATWHRRPAGVETLQTPATRRCNQAAKPDRGKNASKRQQYNQSEWTPWHRRPAGVESLQNTGETPVPR